MHALGEGEAVEWEGFVGRSSVECRLCVSRTGQNTHNLHPAPLSQAMQC